MNTNHSKKSKESHSEQSKESHSKKKSKESNKSAKRTLDDNAAKRSPGPQSKRPRLDDKLEVPCAEDDDFGSVSSEDVRSVLEYPATPLVVADESLDDESEEESGEEEEEYPDSDSDSEDDEEQSQKSGESSASASTDEGAELDEAEEAEYDGNVRDLLGRLLRKDRRWGKEGKEVGFAWTPKPGAGALSMHFGPPVPGRGGEEDDGPQEGDELEDSLAMLLLMLPTPQAAQRVVGRTANTFCFERLEAFEARAKKADAASLLGRLAAARKRFAVPTAFGEAEASLDDLKQRVVVTTCPYTLLVATEDDDGKEQAAAKFAEPQETPDLLTSLGEWDECGFDPAGDHDDAWVPQLLPKKRKADAGRPADPGVQLYAVHGWPRPDWEEASKGGKDPAVVGSETYHCHAVLKV